MKASRPPPNHISAPGFPSALALAKTSPLDIDKNSTLAFVSLVNSSKRLAYLSLVATTLKVFPLKSGYSASFFVSSATLLSSFFVSSAALLCAAVVSGVSCFAQALKLPSIRADNIKPAINFFFITLSFFICLNKTIP